LGRRYPSRDTGEPTHRHRTACKFARVIATSDGPSDVVTKGAERGGACAPGIPRWPRGFEAFLRRRSQMLPAPHRHKQHRAAQRPTPSGGFSASEKSRRVPAYCYIERSQRTTARRVLLPLLVSWLPTDNLLGIRAKALDTAKTLDEIRSRANYLTSVIQGKKERLMHPVRAKRE